MLNVISEAGLYSLILKSRKPEAKAFKRWITHEVIPDIRQYGMYATNDFLDKALSNPDNWIRMLTEYSAVKKENESLKLETVEQKAVIESQNNQITLMKPKATYYDLVLQTKNAVEFDIAYKGSSKTRHPLRHAIGNGKRGCVQYRPRRQTAALIKMNGLTST